MIDINTIDHEVHMTEALREAQAALERGDRPVDCVIVHDGWIVARGSNREFTTRSKFEHTKTRALRSCAPYLFEHSNGCILYTTVEPCIMCLGTIVMANIRYVVYGTADPVAGGTAMCSNVDYVRRSIRGCYIGGILADQSDRLQVTFAQRKVLRPSPQRKGREST